MAKGASSSDLNHKAAWNEFFRRVLQAANGAWPYIFAQFGIPGYATESTVKHYKCPKGGCPSTKDSCRFANWDNDGAIICSQCAPKGIKDGIDTLVWWTGKKKSEIAILVGKVYGLHPPAASIQKNETKTSSKRPMADVATRDRVYRAFIRECQLLEMEPGHKQNLLDRGLTEQDIQAGMYISFPQIIALRKKAIDATRKVLGWENVPGMHKVDERWSKSLFIPTFNVAGQITGMRTRPDRPGTGGKYRWLAESQEFEGPWPGHAPPGVRGPANEIRITEGELKAHAATVLSKIPTIGCPGANGWSPIWDAIQGLVRDLKPRIIRLAFDADARTNQAIAKVQHETYLELTKMNFDVQVETWEREHGKGIDDVLLAQSKDPKIEIKVLKGEEAKAYCSLSGDLPLIVLTVDELKSTDEAIDALAKATNKKAVQVFQRGGNLVEVHGSVTTFMGIEPAQIALMEEPRIREILSFVARYGTEHEEKFETSKVPRTLVQQVKCRQRWKGIPHLNGIVTTPTFLPDGSVLDQPGYHAASGLYFSSDIEFPEINPNPTKADAAAAVAKLLDIVCDFPFEKDHDRSAWLAALLTVAARPAIAGPTPLFAIDANRPGAGKSMLGDVISYIHSGAEPETAPIPGTDDEMRKKILGILLKGSTIAMFDNAADEINFPSLDSLLTRTTWSDRVLGSSAQSPTLPNYTTWLLTGNNLIFGGDIIRRVIRIQLTSLLDNPEDKTTFRHGNLKDTIKNNRGELAIAAATILRAWHVAGRQQVFNGERKQLGSFEAWSSVVTKAIQFAGMPDPLLTVREIRKQSDQKTDLLRNLITGIRQLDSGNHGLTVKEIIHAPNKPILLAVALEDFQNSRGELNTRSVGKKFEKFKNVTVDGRYLSPERTDRGNTWKVREVSLPDNTDNNDVVSLATQVREGEKNPDVMKQKNIFDNVTQSQRAETTPVLPVLSVGESWADDYFFKN